MEVGNIVYSHVVQKGYVKAAGQEVYREDYPLLYQFAQENELLLSEAEWANGRQGMYSAGDGRGTFRVPDLRGQFLRALDEGVGVDAGRVLGSRQGDAIRNITAYQAGLYSKYIDMAPVTNGAFIKTYEQVPYQLNGSVNGKQINLTLDASRVVPTAAENRPKNIALIAQIKY